MLTMCLAPGHYRSVPRAVFFLRLLFLDALVFFFLPRKIRRALPFFSDRRLDVAYDDSFLGAPCFRFPVEVLSKRRPHLGP